MNNAISPTRTRSNSRRACARSSRRAKGLSSRIPRPNLLLSRVGRAARRPRNARRARGRRRRRERKGRAASREGRAPGGGRGRGENRLGAALRSHAAALGAAPSLARLSRELQAHNRLVPSRRGNLHDRSRRERPARGAARRGGGARERNRLQEHSDTVPNSRGGRDRDLDRSPLEAARGGGARADRRDRGLRQLDVLRHARPLDGRDRHYQDTRAGEGQGERPRRVHLRRSRREGLRREAQAPLRDRGRVHAPTGGRSRGSSRSSATRAGS